MKLLLFSFFTVVSCCLFAQRNDRIFTNLDHNFNADTDSIYAYQQFENLFYAVKMEGTVPRSGLIDKDSNTVVNFDCSWIQKQIETEHFLILNANRFIDTANFSAEIEVLKISKSTNTDGSITFGEPEIIAGMYKAGGSYTNPNYLCTVNGIDYAFFNSKSGQITDYELSAVKGNILKYKDSTCLFSFKDGQLHLFKNVENVFGLENNYPFNVVLKEGKLSLWADDKKILEGMDAYHLTWGYHRWDLGNILVQNDSKLGIFNRHGKQLYPFELDYAKNLITRQIYSVLGVSYMWPDYTDPDYENYYHEGYERLGEKNVNKYKALWVVQKDGKWGMIDHKGKVIVPIEFDSEIYQTQKDYDDTGHVLFQVKKDGRYGLYELGEGIVLTCKYDQIYEIGYSRWDELVYEVIENGKIKLLDENFEEIPGLDIYESPARGYYVEKVDSAYKLYAVTKNGVELVAGRAVEDYKVAGTHYTFVELKVNGLWGIFDVNHFTWIYEPIFEEIVWGGIDHFWAVKRNGKYGFVAANGTDLSDFSIVDRSIVEKNPVVKSPEGIYPHYEKPFNGRRMNVNETYILGKIVNTSPFRRYWPQK